MAALAQCMKCLRRNVPIDHDGTCEWACADCNWETDVDLAHAGFMCGNDGRRLSAEEAMAELGPRPTPVS